MSPTVTATCFSENVGPLNNFESVKQNKNLFSDLRAPRNVDFSGYGLRIYSLSPNQTSWKCTHKFASFISLLRLHRFLMDSERSQDRQGRCSKMLGWLFDDEAFQGKFSS